MSNYSEGEVRLAALEILAENADGLTTTELRRVLTEWLAPSGHDVELVASRGNRDTFFDQRVRNLTSHRGSAVSLVRAGLVTYAGHGSPLVITDRGRDYLAELRRGGRTTEAEFRTRQWNAVLARGGPVGVTPAVLNELRIYRGGHGVWTDAERTRQYAPEHAPITVALLHTGARHAKDLTTDGLAYHYPRTEQGRRDSASIEATIRAARLRLPVFVVTHSANDRLRDVRRAAVVGWDDDTELFDVVFADPPVDGRPIPARTVGLLGSPYRRANEQPRTATRVPFDVDPNAVDRALASHAKVQNALADWVRAHSYEPISSNGRSVDFDLAWVDGDTFYVAEVKSLPPGKEARQLRLGLGQVLHYQALLEEERRVVQPVLAIEHAPGEDRWLSICRAHGVRLVWPPDFERLLGPWSGREAEISAARAGPSQDGP